MAFTLNEGGKVKYSKGEKRIFKFLKDNVKRSSTTLMGLYYGNEDVPFHGRGIVISLLSSIRRKADENKEPFRVASTERSGPHAMQFWLESRK